MDKRDKSTRFLEAELENPVLGIRPVLEADFSRDNFENEHGASDYQNL